MAIVTGRPKRDADEFIRRFQLDSVFKVVVCMEDTKKHKPNPHPLLLVGNGFLRNQETDH